MLSSAGMIARVASRKAAGNLSVKVLAVVSFDKGAVPELKKIFCRGVYHIYP